MRSTVKACLTLRVLNVLLMFALIFFIFGFDLDFMYSISRVSSETGEADQCTRAREAIVEYGDLLADCEPWLAAEKPWEELPADRRHAYVDGAWRYSKRAQRFAELQAAMQRAVRWRSALVVYTYSYHIDDLLLLLGSFRKYHSVSTSYILIVVPSANASDLPAAEHLRQSANLKAHVYTLNELFSGAFMDPMFFPSSLDALSPSLRFSYGLLRDALDALCEPDAQRAMLERTGKAQSLTPLQLQTLFRHCVTANATSSNGNDATTPRGVSPTSTERGETSDWHSRPRWRYAPSLYDDLKLLFSMHTKAFGSHPTDWTGEFLSYTFLRAVLLARIRAVGVRIDVVACVDATDVSLQDSLMRFVFSDAHWRETLFVDVERACRIMHEREARGDVDHAADWRRIVGGKRVNASGDTWRHQMQSMELSCGSRGNYAQAVWIRACFGVSRANQTGPDPMADYFPVGKDEMWTYDSLIAGTMVGSGAGTLAYLSADTYVSLTRLTRPACHEDESALNFIWSTLMSRKRACFDSRVAADARALSLRRLCLFEERHADHGGSMLHATMSHFANGLQFDATNLCHNARAANFFPAIGDDDLVADVARRRVQHTSVVDIHPNDLKCINISAARKSGVRTPFRLLEYDSADQLARSSGFPRFLQSLYAADYGLNRPCDALPRPVLIHQTKYARPMLGNVDVDAHTAARIVWKDL